MCIIVAHVVSTIVFKYCNFVLLLVNRVILLDLLQVKTTGKFDIYLPTIINKGKFKIILHSLQGCHQGLRAGDFPGLLLYEHDPTATSIGINKEDRMKRTS